MSDQRGSARVGVGAFDGETAVQLAAGELEAGFLPRLGLLGASLRHRGEGLGIAPSGNALDIHGMAMALIRNGQIVEAWNCFDFLTLYAQVGLVQRVLNASRRH